MKFLTCLKFESKKIAPVNDSYKSQLNFSKVDLLLISIDFPI